MPEEQATPSCSQPPLASDSNQHLTNQQDVSHSTSQDTKRTYLSLLLSSQLIDLLLAIDADRNTPIFPPDLDGAITAIKEPQQQQQQPIPAPIPAPPPVSVVVKLEPTAANIPPLALSPPAVAASSSAVQPLAGPPGQSVPPPQYKPPTQKLPVYPYTHTPYYPPPVHPPPPTTHPPIVSPPAPPARHPLFTSTPLTRDSNNSISRPTPPPLISSRDDPNAMPSYEEMLVEAIMDVGDVEGTAPKILFQWMAQHYPLQQNFRPSASQALHKALKRGRLEKVGGKYRLNPSWGGGPTTSKRATRRPTANRAGSPSAASHPAPAPVGQPLPPLPTPYHTPYGFHTFPPHPGMPFPPPPYAPWISGQPIPLPPHIQQQMEAAAAAAAAAPKAEDAEDDIDLESEDGEMNLASDVAAHEPTYATTTEDATTRESIRQSLLRLASVLKRFAKKGEGT
ncbi:hypothetical protein M422DRAFT_775522 [Sphaerobolus stellatus SS14]|nr:hypothetical protein M422DRAFT_775522 [Sphaerobolus stellatus SS14]